jgi:RES domain-containing protein
VVYAAEHRSLAMLELLAHVDRDQLPTDYAYTGLDVPDEAIVDLEKRPEGWDANPHGAASCEIGDRFVVNSAGIALRVPSVIVPGECNLIINPGHPRFREVRIEHGGPARIDLRTVG